MESNRSGVDEGMPGRGDGKVGCWGWARKMNQIQASG